MTRSVDTGWRAAFEPGILYENIIKCFSQVRQAAKVVEAVQWLVAHRDELAD